MKAPRKRLTAEARRHAIVKAARPLFAEHGFKGTSIRMIAEASNVSEALLYKHFPDKETIYKEMFKYSLGQIDIIMKGLIDIKAGSETVVLLVYTIFFLILMEMPGRAVEQRSFERLLLQSLLGDAKFAQSIFKVYHNKFMGIITKSLKIAARQGDIVKSTISNENRIWFAHHLAMGLQLLFMTGEPAYTCRLSKDELVNEGGIYSLRGMGMTDEAIKKYFKPGDLKAYVTRLMR
jgi:AcrR family transcriptional regulator